MKSNFDQFIQNTKKLVETANDRVNQWKDEVSQNPDWQQWQQQIQKMPAELSVNLEQWKLQIAESLKNLPANSITSNELIKDLTQRVQKEWLRAGDWLEESEWSHTLQRYSNAIQTLTTIYVRTQVFEYTDTSQENTPERVQKKFELHEKNAKELAELCKKQGGAWIKAAQFLSVQGEWLPEIYQKQLVILQDKAPPASWVEISTVLDAELGSDWEKIFQSIEKVPIATASIAQVHKAVLNDGTVIALKVQLPDAPKKIESDLKFFKLAARLFSLQSQGLSIEKVVNELSKSIMLELDYFHEAANLKCFHGSYPNEEWLFPELMPNLLTVRTLGMNFVEGSQLRVFLEEVPTAADSVLKILVKSFLRQIFITGLFHADPHPGNFFISPQGQLALLDFGAVGELTEKETRSYREVLTALILKQEFCFEQKLERAGFVVPEPEKLKSLLFQQQKDNTGKQVHLEQLSQLQYHLKIMRETNVEIPEHFVLLARVLVSIGGLLKQYKVKLAPMELAQMLM